MKRIQSWLVAFSLLLMPCAALSETGPEEAANGNNAAPADQAIVTYNAPSTKTATAADALPADKEEAAKKAPREKMNENEEAAAKKDSEVEEEGEAEEEEIEEMAVADPIEPFNRLMFNFNDKLYFWVLKPVAKAYKRVVPEGARISVSNFFYNITTPIRFVNSLLQLKMKSAGTELARLVVNSTAGMGGLFDVAKEWNLMRQDEDTGQTLGHYGIKEGFYIVWPFLGPSNARDTIGTAGDVFLDPVNYIRPVEASLGVTAYERVNNTSLHLGEYEDMKESAIDPYIAVRDAYIQNRRYKVEE